MRKLTIFCLAAVLIATGCAAVSAGPTCKAGETYDAEKKKCVAG